MGYTTEFFGRFDFSRKLTAQQHEYLNCFANSRRMKRDVAKIPTAGLNDQARENVGLPYGIEGGFVAPQDNDFGQT